MKASSRGFLAALFLFATTCIFSQNADISLLKNINVNGDEHLDGMFRFITNTALPLSAACPLFIYTGGLLKKKAFLKKAGLYTGESILASLFMSTALKYAVNRPRPYVTYGFIEKETSAGSPSFPSGHTSLAFSTATSLSLAFPKWYVIVPAFVWAGAVGYSRMDLGVHYPSDVLAGALLGSTTAWLTYKVNKWLIKKRLKKTGCFL